MVSKHIGFQHEFIDGVHLDVHAVHMLLYSKTVGVDLHEATLPTELSRKRRKP